MWVGVCLTVIIELVPTHLRNTGIGFYFFVISNIGGNIQILVPPVQNWIQSSLGLTKIDAFRGSLLFIYVSLTLFILSNFILIAWNKRRSLHFLSGSIHSRLTSLSTNTFRVKTRHCQTSADRCDQTAYWRHIGIEQHIGNDNRREKRLESNLNCK